MRDVPDGPSAWQSQGRIAYLTGVYPAISHTFVLREVAALRSAGQEVITCSVRRPASGHLIGSEEIEAASSTFYLLPALRKPLTLAAALGSALMSPHRLRAALRQARGSGATGIKQNLRQIIYLIEAAVLARHLRQCGARRIHNQLGMASASVSMYASILGGLSFSLSLHGPDDFFPHERALLAQKIVVADVVACISEFCREQAKKCCSPEHWHKLHLVRCGVDPARYRRCESRDAGQRILFVGRLSPVKGVPVLLEAFSEVAASLPDAVLTIVGEGPERRSCETRARQLGIHNRVSFTGALDQRAVSAQMSEADLFVLPSFDEGLPVVLMEAMAAELPVIATRVAGIPELVKEGVTGRLVAAGDAVGLKAAMLKHFRDPGATKAMTSEALSLVLSQHDMWKEGRRLAELLSG